MDLVILLHLVSLYISSREIVQTILVDRVEIKELMQLQKELLSIPAGYDLDVNHLTVNLVISLPPPLILEIVRLLEDVLFRFIIHELGLLIDFRVADGAERHPPSLTTPPHSCITQHIKYL